MNLDVRRQFVGPLLLMVLGACEPQGTRRLVDYVMQREGVPRRAVGVSWMAARVSVGHEDPDVGFTGHIACVIPVGDRLLTDSGQILPVMHDVLELVALDTGLVPDDNEEFVRFQRQLGHHESSSRAVREWFRRGLLSGAHDSLAGDQANDWVMAECRRIVVLMQNQAVSWQHLSDCSAALTELSLALGCAKGVVDMCERTRSKIAESGRFRLGGSAEDSTLMRVMRSDVDSVGDVASGRPEKRYRNGKFRASYLGLGVARRSYGQLLDFWDSQIWTRTVVIGEFGPESQCLGDRIRSAAASLMGREACTKEEFRSWITK